MAGLAKILKRCQKWILHAKISRKMVLHSFRYQFVINFISNMATGGHFGFLLLTNWVKEDQMSHILASEDNVFNLSLNEICTHIYIKWTIYLYLYTYRTSFLAIGSAASALPLKWIIEGGHWVGILNAITRQCPYTGLQITLAAVRFFRHT